MKRSFLYILLSLLLVLMLGGCSSGDENRTQAISVDYYFTPSCDSCNDGETFAVELGEKLADVIEEDQYEIHLKDVSRPEYYEEFNRLAEQNKSDDFYPAPPVVKVNDQYLFGIEAIQSQTRKLVIEEKNRGLTPEEQLATFQDIDPEISYFVYFYKPDCPYCEDAETYMEKMDKEQTLLDGTVSKLKINYVDISKMENMPLADYFFEKYQVPQDDRKTPVLFYQNGYIRKYENIVKELPNIINEGKATNWENIDYVPASENNWMLYGGIAVVVVAAGVIVLLLVRRKKRGRSFQVQSAG